MLISRIRDYRTSNLMFIESHGYRKGGNNFLKVIGLAAILLICFASEASAQWSPQVVRIGACVDEVARVAYEVDSNLWFRNVHFHNNQFRAMRDPSGMTFLLLPSADPWARYWVTWDLAVVRFDATGSQIRTGGCQLDPQFVKAHRPPPPPSRPALDFDEIEYRHESADQAVALHIPSSVVDPNTEFLPPLLPKQDDAKRCLEASEGDRNQFYTCVLERTLSGRQLAAYQCVAETKTKEGVALCLLEGSLGKNERRALSDLEKCAAKHADDWSQYPMCMADGRFDPETVRGIQCAQQNLQGPKPNYWGLAACYVGPKLLKNFRPNAETAIAIECAMTSGGEPAVFASCTGGQLAVRELDKCLQNGIGGKGCFGDNNFFVQAHRALDQKIVDAVGKNSVAYHAWQAASSMTDPIQLAKTANNVVREAGAAAENIGRELSKVAPRIKIKRIKLSFGSLAREERAVSVERCAARMLYSESRYLFRMSQQRIGHTSHQRECVASPDLKKLKAEVQRGLDNLEAGEYFDVEEGELERFMNSLIPKNAAPLSKRRRRRR